MVKTAVLLIDLQNEFAKPGGKLHESVKKVMKYTGMLRSVPHFVTAARNHGATIIHSPVIMGEKSGRLRFSEDDLDPEYFSSIDGLFEEETWNAEIIDELAPESKDIVLRGRTNFSACSGTYLKKILARKKIERLFVAGFLINQCILETIFDLEGMASDGLEITVLEDGCGAESQEQHANTINMTLPLLCKVTTCKKALTEWNSQPHSKAKPKVKIESDLETDSRSPHLLLNYSESEHQILQKRVASSFFITGDKSARATRISHFIRKNQSSKTIHKKELQEILLRCTGLVVSEVVLDDIFKRANIHDKSLTPEEIATYINEIKPIKGRERRKWIVRKLFRSLSLWFTIMFVLGGIFVISINLRTREGGDLYAVKHRWWQVPAWLWQIGSFGFVFNVIEHERLVFDRFDTTCRKLIQWIRNDLPPLYARQLVEKKLLRNFAERMTLNTFAKNVEASTPTNNSDVLDEEVLDAKNFRIILESMGVFVSHDELARVVGKIEKYGTKVNLKSLVAFVRSREEKLGEQNKKWELSKRCLTKVGFWTSLCFVIGTAAWVAADLVSGPTLVNSLNGTCIVLYFIGAVGGQLSVYDAATHSLAEMSDINGALRFVAVKIGLLLSFFNKEIVRCSTVHGVKQDDMAILTADEIKQFQSTGAQSVFEIDSPGSSKDTIDVVYFSEVLEKFGVYFSQAQLDRLWAEIAQNESQVQKETIINYIAVLEPEYSSGEKFQLMLKEILYSLSFWMVNVQITAASIHLVAQFVTFENVDSRNLFLAGSVGWVISSGWSAVLAVNRSIARFELLETNEFMLKEAVLGSTKNNDDDPVGANQDRFSQVRSLFAGASGDKREQLIKRTETSRDVLTGLKTVTSSRELFLNAMAAKYESKRNLL